MSKTYSVKYLGISNGQLGILSKRLPVPRMSRLDSCKNKPLPVIYAAAYRLPRSSPKRIKSLIPKIDVLDESFKDSSVSDMLSPHKPTEPVEIPMDLSKSESEASGPMADPQKYDIWLVNKYSRPRGLKTAKKPKVYRDLVHDNWLEDRFELYKRRSVMTPVPRSGLAGWKISRPRTPATRASSQAGMRRTPVGMGDLEVPVIESNPGVHEEMYLKYLKLKRQMTAEDSKSVS